MNFRARVELPHLVRNCQVMEETSNIASVGVLFDGRYKLLRPLSSDGGTADVWLALDINTIDEVYDDTEDRLTSDEESGIKVAIKIYRPKNALDVGDQRFRDEFKIVFNCHHTNLVQPINFSIYKGVPYLVLPFCKNGSSERLLGKISDKDELWRYIADVSAGLAYLHSFNPTIVHHDIKPANILVDDSNNFAITDFGISSHRGFNREGYDDSQSGTMAYMAPERFADDYESMPESDIWSFGATLYELVTGQVPFGEEGGMAQVRSGNKPVPPIAGPIPNDIKALIYDCLSLDPSRRPSAGYILKAAEGREYPVKNRMKYYIAGGTLAVVLAILLIVLLIPRKDKPGTTVQPSVPDSELFAGAMELVDSPDAGDLREGLARLDSLGNLGYVPALYQLAYTYGWYSDSASVARKQLLGIEYYPRDTDEGLLPKSQAINTKAIALFSRIEEIDNPDYPDINANAMYRLACYYVNENRVFKRDVGRAETLLKASRKWAEISRDSILLRRIDAGLEELKLSKEER